MELDKEDTETEGSAHQKSFLRMDKWTKRGAIVGAIPIFWMLQVLMGILETISYYPTIITLPLPMKGASSGHAYENARLRAWKKGVSPLVLPGVVLGLSTLMYLLYGGPVAVLFALLIIVLFVAAMGPRVQYTQKITISSIKKE